MVPYHPIVAKVVRMEGVVDRTDQGDVGLDEFENEVAMRKVGFLSQMCKAS